MRSKQLSTEQCRIIETPIEGSIFLEGHAGTGKTTTGVERTLHLLTNGVRADSILVMTPQRTLAQPYYVALQETQLPAGDQVVVLTLGGLARRMIELFWPLVAEPSGFSHPDRPPTFLTLETAQYHLANVIQSYLDRGFFEGLSIPRKRLYSQILDNLNKSAVVGFPYTEIGDRLKKAWIGEVNQIRFFEEAQVCAHAFRQACYENNLLDFSLQIEIFHQDLWHLPLFRDYLADQFNHLIVDNLEEDTPVAHDVLREWLPEMASALMIYDSGGGYRRFLGADPEGGRLIKERCDRKFKFRHSFVISPVLNELDRELRKHLIQKPTKSKADIRSVLHIEYHRYHPQMLDWIGEEIHRLVDAESVPPGEIVVLAPFMKDALRFSLMQCLTRLGIPSYSQRPSRELREEPVARCLLTFAILAHPQWDLQIKPLDVIQALTIAIHDLDAIRAQLLAKILCRWKDGVPRFEPFEQVMPAMQARITKVYGERYDELRRWLEVYRRGPEIALDHFFQRLFGEILSQNGYGFYDEFKAAEVASKLIESARKFRWMFETTPTTKEDSAGKEYLRVVEEGLSAAIYIQDLDRTQPNAVLLAPAYTFLMANRPVDYQFWLDVGGHGWWERLYQPLTHPYVLSRSWPYGAPWTDADEYRTRQEGLYALVSGLIHRCRCGIFLGLSEISESGFEQRGPLLRAFQQILLRLPNFSLQDDPHV
jgi:hypothetical protein